MITTKTFLQQHFQLAYYESNYIALSEHEPILAETYSLIHDIELYHSVLTQLIKDKKFENIVVDEIKEGNSFKYLTGSFENDFNLANKLKNEMRLKGFPNSFVIAFKNNIRIHIDEAIRLTKTR